MPKIKTNRSAAKRFRRTATGKIKRSHAFAKHILTKKSRRRKRRLKAATYVDKTNLNKIKRLVPYI
ncbi:MAG: 50S ribosomal protein L35 [candidate division Zixibacteria bacterium RBG-1]|nr:MAG: 50S ribosomal protein L35 [candidate division Zixibacteria bacterium RBG-1]OGC86504.1 MAG: 50S ribosomal protein L35 [candidate division Zixibacteria bacterium RBG_19FT_COMBO_42_43]